MGARARAQGFAARQRLFPIFISNLRGLMLPMMLKHKRRSLNKTIMLIYFRMGQLYHRDTIYERAKRKVPFFEHAQNVQIHIILRMRKVSSVHKLSINAFTSIQCICKQMVYTLIRLRGCAGWSGPSLSAYARKVFWWRGSNDVDMQVSLLRIIVEHVHLR